MASFQLNRGCQYRRVAAETDCLVYVWDFNAVQQMTGAASPALATFWRNYILYSLGSAYSDSTNEVCGH